MLATTPRVVLRRFVCFTARQPRSSQSVNRADQSDYCIWQLFMRVARVVVLLGCFSECPLARRIGCTLAAFEFEIGNEAMLPAGLRVYQIRKSRSIRIYSFAVTSHTTCQKASGHRLERAALNPGCESVVISVYYRPLSCGILSTSTYFGFDATTRVCFEQDCRENEAN